VDSPLPSFLIERMKRWSPKEKEQLRSLFLEEKLSITDIAERVGRSTASINNAITRSGMPRQRWVKKLRMPESMTPALARIHAHVCGDGHLYLSREKDDYGYLKAYKHGYYRLRYGFGYTNLNRELIRSFMDDVLEVFGLTPLYYTKQNEVRVKSKAAWMLLKRLGAGGSRKWFLPDEIVQASDKVKIAWLSAFFDDEACFDPSGRIRVRSVNRPGLEQVTLMLSRFVTCHLTPEKGLYRDGSCYLVVSNTDRDKFLRLIGSIKYSNIKAD